MTLTSPQPSFGVEAMAAAVLLPIRDIEMMDLNETMMTTVLLGGE
jgi:hypothetical protein